MSKIDKHLSAAQEALRKDFERAFGVSLSRWRIFQQPCMIWDKHVMCKVIKTAIILHTMIVEYRRDGYDSGMFVEAEKAVSGPEFLDANGNYKPFIWRSREGAAAEEGVVLSDGSWVGLVADRERRITDEVEHYGLKFDLVRHVWSNWGMRPTG